MSSGSVNELLNASRATLSKYLTKMAENGRRYGYAMEPAGEAGELVKNKTRPMLSHGRAWSSLFSRVSAEDAFEEIQRVLRFAALDAA